MKYKLIVYSYNNNHCVPINKKKKKTITLAKKGKNNQKDTIKREPAAINLFDDLKLKNFCPNNNNIIIYYYH